MTATVQFDIEAAADALGARPETPVRLMQLAMDEETTTQQLEEVVNADPATAMRTLKLANSAFYGMSHRVSRMDRAITMLGCSTIAKLAATCSVESAFAGMNIDAPGITSTTAWRYGVAVAFAGEVIVRECPTSNSVAIRRLSAEAFVTGLIHDIGMVVEAKLWPAEFTAAVNASLKSGVPLVKHEQRQLGTDHAEIGRRLAEHWQLPAELINGIAFHHDPLAAEPDYRSLACVIHVAAQTVRLAGSASFDGDADTPLLADALTHLHIDPRRIDTLVNAVRDRVKNISF